MEFEPSTKACNDGSLHRSAGGTLHDASKFAFAMCCVMNNAQATTGIVVVGAGGIERSAGCRRSVTKFVFAIFKFLFFVSKLIININYRSLTESLKKLHCSIDHFTSFRIIVLYI